jgi:hypothetical protein
LDETVRFALLTIVGLEANSMKKNPLVKPKTAVNAKNFGKLFLLKLERF